MEYYKLLSLGDRGVMNIGDYIQALASSQFYPHVDGFVYREKLKDYKDEPCNMIMNGWYMHDPSQWPPSRKINPLFVALHINASVAEKLLSNEGISYLKQYEPIGCRDYYTRDLLIEKGINAYFSGCMTLTLGNSFKSEKKDKTCYFVDPVIETPKSIWPIILSLFTLVTHYKSVRRIFKKRPSKNKLLDLLRTANFYRLYSKVFTKDLLESAEYLSQQSDYYSKGFNDDFERLKEAERLVRLYSKASLVVTRRIHCALPCLGLETPVIFTANKNASTISSCRFGGIVDLLNVIYCDEKSIESAFEHDAKIDIHHFPENKNSWKKYAQNLTVRCHEFINSTQTKVF
ncbi:MAG: polysaccharide pyruvyl transferase family protein [Bacteroidales bacterium]|nr:polysaccharide pyruvyl transferase family protein [Bacteroidales bacterium]